MEQVCVEGIVGYAGIITGIVTGASIIANLVKPDSVIGKIVNYIAFNIKVKK